MSFTKSVLTSLLLATVSSAASAAFVAPVSWTRPTTLASGQPTYQHWDLFNSTSGDDADVANFNFNGDALVTVTSPGSGSFVTGGGTGNIYSSAGAATFEVTIPEADIPTPAHDVTAIVQFKTQGIELDYSSVLMNGLAPVDTAELARESLGGFGGASVETWMLFNIPYASFGSGTPGVSNLTLTFGSSEAHMSLDQLAIDTAVRPFGFYAEPNPVAASVPEPGTGLAAMLGTLAMLTVGAVRRKQR